MLIISNGSYLKISIRSHPFSTYARRGRGSSPKHTLMYKLMRGLHKNAYRGRVKNPEIFAYVLNGGLLISSHLIWCLREKCLLVFILFHFFNLGNYRRVIKSEISGNSKIDVQSIRNYITIFNYSIIWVFMLHNTKR